MLNITFGEPVIIKIGVYGIYKHFLEGYECVKYASAMDAPVHHNNR